MEDTKHVGVVAIIIRKRTITAPKVNRILTDYGELIVGRLGLPYGNHGLHVISLIVAGSQEQLNKFVADLKAVPDVVVESTMSDICGA